MILVTGGAGYIGSHFVRRYCATNPKQQVLVVDNLSNGHEEALSGLSSVLLEKEDIGDYEAMKKLFSKHSIDYVVHFAASINVGESQKQPNKYFDNNIINSLVLFRVMEDSGVRKIVFSSTAGIYGNPHYLPIDEQHPQEPTNIYGLTKMIVEKVLAGYAQTSAWSYVVLRYFNACGADENGIIGERHNPETHIIPLALMVASGRLDIVDIYGDNYDTADGTCIRDYIHVCDLADAHLQALDLLKQQKGGETINLGSAQGASVKEILAICEEVSGVKIRRRIVERRKGDPACLVADTAKATRKLNWSPKYNLRRAIETAWSWENNRLF